MKELNWNKVFIIVLLFLVGGIIVPFALITFLWMIFTNSTWKDTWLGELFSVWE